MASPKSLRPDVAEEVQDLLHCFYDELGENPRGGEDLADLARSIQGEIESRKGVLKHLDYLKSKAVFETFEDVIGLYWKFSLELSEDDGPPTLLAHPPDLTSSNEQDRKEMKSRIRETLTTARDEQLREESTRSFVRKMESPSNGGKNGKLQGKSVQNLILSPSALAEDLQVFADAPVHEKLGQLKDIVQPYLQFVDTDKNDRFTGLRLLDIWRYARHTWSIPHKQTPGRRMKYLVRDAARENHPLIGIGAICSGVMQLTPRDREIGWSPIALAKPKYVKKYARDELGKSPTKNQLTEVRASKFEEAFGGQTFQAIRSLESQLDESLNNLWVQDFLEEGIVGMANLKRPSAKCIDTIEKKRESLSNAQSESFTATEDYEQDAQSDLYTRKRITALKRILSAKRKIQEFLQEHSDASDEKLRRQAVSNKDVRVALKTALRSVKKRRMAGLVDITTCGAIPPYNEVLGGKLVSFLMASPKVISQYRQRYGDQESVIASRMKGAPVVRRPELVLLSTTSLYAVGSSQYNRLKAPTANGELCYEEVGKSSGHGHIHISERTFQTLKDLLVEISTDDEDGGILPNNQFGNGVNYKMRAIKTALSEIGIEPLHQHEHPRLIYLVPLTKNWREYLTGIDEDPEYLYADTEENPDAETQALIDFWKIRWFYKRAQKDFIIERLVEDEGKVKVSDLVPEIEKPEPDPAPLFEKEL
jgi:hypothetical protein